MTNSKTTFFDYNYIVSICVKLWTKSMFGTMSRLIKMKNVYQFFLRTWNFWNEWVENSTSRKINMDNNSISWKKSTSSNHCWILNIEVANDRLQYFPWNVTLARLLEGTFTSGGFVFGGNGILSTTKKFGYRDEPLPSWFPVLLLCCFQDQDQLQPQIEKLSSPSVSILLASTCSSRITYSKIWSCPREKISCCCSFWIFKCNWGFTGNPAMTLKASEKQKLLVIELT